MNKFVWKRLHEIVLALSVDCLADASNLQVFECDHRSEGHFARFGGAEAAREMLLGEHGKKPPHPPVLVVGIMPLPLDSQSSTAGEAGLQALLSWPGAAYLRYGFTREELCDVVQRICEGAKEPLPRELLPTPEDVLHSISEVRHWLASRLKNTKDALEDFQAAAKGKMALHPSYFNPVEILSKEHRQKLNRLLGFDLYLRRYASSADGLDAIKKNVALFEASWQELEVARQRCRAAVEGKACKELMVAVIQQLDAVCVALKEIIEATRRLDQQIKTGQGLK